MTTEIDSLWQNFLDLIYKEINAASFHAWFHDLVLIKLARLQHKIRIQVPMEIHKKILGDNYYTLIEDTFFKLTGVNFDIEFFLEDEQNDIVDNFQKEIFNEVTEQSLPIDWLKLREWPWQKLLVRFIIHYLYMERVDLEKPI